MSYVVDQRQCLGEIAVQAERSGDGARNLRDLERVGQSIAKVVGIAARENLRLGFEPPEGARMNHAVAVARKIVAVGMLRFGEAASAGVLDVHGVAGQHEQSLTDEEDAACAFHECSEMTSRRRMAACTVCCSC